MIGSVRCSPSTPDAFKHGDTAEFATISVVLQIHNPISTTLPTAPHRFEPIHQRKPNGDLDARPCCLGFHAAMQPRLSVWAPLSDSRDIHHGLLQPILLHCVDDHGQPMLGAPRNGPKTEQTDGDYLLRREKPGIQAIATTSPDLPPVPGSYTTFSRDHEYKRHGTLNLLAGIDLFTGKVHDLVKDRHRSREFIEFLKLLNTAYPAGTAIELILDNHSAHISREPRAWLATQPARRFTCTFAPKHGFNLIEGFFSKFARSVLHHLRVASKQERKERIMLGIKDVNRYPVIHP